MIPGTGKLIASWAKLGCWSKNEYSFLHCLSCRLEDFKFTTFETEETGNYKVALVIEMGGKLYSVMGDGKFKMMTRQMAAHKLVEEAAIHDWIDKNHSKTTREKYLMASSHFGLYLD